MTGPSGRVPSLSVLHAIAAAVDPCRYLLWRERRDGDPFVVKLPGIPPVLLTGRRAGARDLLRAQVEIFESLEPNPIAPLVGDASIIMMSGGRHRRERALLMPPFHGDRMRAYGELIRQSALDQVRTWHPGTTVDLRAHARAITLRVILEAVYGVESHARREIYTRTVPTFLNSYTGPLMIPALRFSVRGKTPWDRFVDARTRFDALIAEDIASRRAAGTRRGVDILGMLLESTYDDGSPIDDRDLCEQLRSLLAAGHETSATSVTWALYELHRNPGIRRKVLAEIAGLGPRPEANALAKLRYLGAVCAETLRLHPPVPVVLRRVNTPLRVNGRTVPAGGTAGIATTVLHADPAVYPDPTTFRPERFLDRHFGPFEYAPFGGGHRRCVGFALAEHEIRIVVATVLAAAEIELCERTARSGPPTVVPHNLATAPRRPIRIRIVDKPARIVGTGVTSVARAPIARGETHV